jgi:hypothetical protein
MLSFWESNAGFESLHVYAKKSVNYRVKAAQLLIYSPLYLFFRLDLDVNKIKYYKNEDNF